MLVLLSLVLPVLHLKLAQLGRQVHEGDRDHLQTKDSRMMRWTHLWFPLEAQGGTEAVIDESPRHLDHLLQFGFVTLQTLGVL